MTLLEAQTAILEGLVAQVKQCWNPSHIYTDQPVLPPTSEDGERPLPEAYINVAEAQLDRPEQQRMTAVCLDQIPEYGVRLDAEIALRESKPEGEPQRLQLHRRAEQLRRAVLWSATGSTRRLFAGQPAYWLGETYTADDFEADPQAEDCLLRVRFYFVVTVTLL